ncbi:Transmembrane protein 68 [Cichlidogyrus casuarinus]|uniref:Transmembrane protein 68 n=1 Tax=Cichlidogyrus casuarinus TaxID=1844966 RepID=A0ABD2QK62_9PLAT
MLVSLWRPILILVVLPFFFVSLLYISAFFTYLVKLRPWITNRCSLLCEEHRFMRLKTIQGPLGASFSVPLPSLDLVSHFIATLWDIHGRIFHGYEVVGMEKISQNKPALLIYYHGTIPLDIYHFVARYVITHGFCPTPIVDNFMLRTPGIQNFIRLTGARAGTVEECVKMLKHDSADDHAPMILIGPGGVREALFSDEYYNTLWGNRTGFAKVALEANCAVYPMFTENIREPIRPMQLGKSLWQRLYEKTRLPLNPLYGYFPVKLRTFIGDPIDTSGIVSPRVLADLINEAVQKLIFQHQVLPGNILRATFQRIPQIDRILNSKKKK